MGSGQHKSLTLEVEFSPEVRSTRPRVAQAVGYEAVLECEIVAFPPPSIFWFRDGKEIRDEAGVYQIQHFAEEDERQTSTLKVRFLSFKGASSSIYDYLKIGHTIDRAHTH